MNIDDTINEFTKAILSAKSIEHTEYIIKEKFNNNDLSIKKRKKLLFLTLSEIKKEKKSLKKEYYLNNQLKDEILLKKKIQLLKVYCDKMKIIQRKNKITNLNINKQKKYKLQKVEKLNDISFDKIPNLKNKKSEYYLYCFENKKPILIDDIYSFIHTYKYFIRNYDLTDYKDVILEYTKQLISSISELNEEEAIVELTSIIDNIKYKKVENNYKTDLNKKIEQQVLKYIKKECKNNLKNLKIEKQEEYDYRIDILEYFIYNVGNYYYIKKLLERIPDIINLRTKPDDYISKKSNFIENEKDEHVLVKIVKLFVYNLEIEMRSQDSNFINRDYYKQMYLLILNNPNIELNIDDKIQIKNHLDKILEHLKNNRYEESRKEKAVKDILEMKENINTKEISNKKIMTNQLEQELNYLTLYKNQSLKEKERVNLTKNYLKDISSKVEQIKEKNNITTKEIARLLNIKTYDITNSLNFSDTIMFEGNRFAYSLALDDEYNYYFKIHTLDMTSYINDESMLERDLYNGIYSLNKVNLNKYLKIHLNEEIPTITYQFKILRNGYISNFKMYNSKISVDKIYNSSDMDNYRNDELLKEFIGIYRLINQNDRSNITIRKYNELFNDLISENIFNYVTKNDIPFIIKGNNDLNYLRYLELNPELCYLFSKVDKNTYKNILRIINNCNNIKHYSLDSFDGFNEINILGDLNYEHYLNQKIIKEIIKNNQNIKDKYEIECEEVVNSLNDSIGYIDIKEQPKSKNKLKKR